MAPSGQLQVQPQGKVGGQVDTVGVDDDHAAAAVATARAASGIRGMRGKFCGKNEKITFVNAFSSFLGGTAHFMENAHDTKQNYQLHFPTRLVFEFIF